MELKNLEEKTVQIVNTAVAVYTPGDIQQLIINDLESKGYDIDVQKEIRFECSVTTESDAWGMNPHQIARLVKATAYIK